MTTPSTFSDERLNEIQTELDVSGIYYSGSRETVVYLLARIDELEAQSDAYLARGNRAVDPNIYHHKDGSCRACNRAITAASRAALAALDQTPQETRVAPLCAFIDPLGRACRHEQRQHQVEPEYTWCAACQAMPDPGGPQFVHPWTPQETTNG